MELTFWPLLLVWIIILGVGGWLLRRRLGTKDSRPTDALAAAHTDQVRRTARYQQLARTHWRWSIVQLVAVGLAVLGTVLLTTRFATAATDRPEQHNRDIVLCLDVSDSMTSVDAGILAAFADIAAGLEGERIGLTIWNSSAITIFPLTNDYAFIANQLDGAATALEEFDFDFTAGTVQGEGSSLIGDGLASCLQRFDRPEETRSRSIIFASDNKVSGEQVFELPEAADLAIEREVAVYGVTPPYGLDGDEGAAMKKTLDRTGGVTRSLDNPDLAAELVDQIEAEEAQRMEGSPRRIVADRPLVGLLLVGLGLAGLAVAGWRTRQ